MEFLYGTCARPFVAFSYRATMTISRKNSDPLIYLASVRTDPDELVFATRSLPARSTFQENVIEYLIYCITMTWINKHQMKFGSADSVTTWKLSFQRQWKYTMRPRGRLHAIYWFTNKFESLTLTAPYSSVFPQRLDLFRPWIEGSTHLLLIQLNA